VRVAGGVVVVGLVLVVVVGVTDVVVVVGNSVVVVPTGVTVVVGPGVIVVVAGASVVELCCVGSGVPVLVPQATRASVARTTTMRRIAVPFSMTILPPMRRNPDAIWVTRESHGVCSTRMGSVAERHTVQLPEGEFSYLELGRGNPVVFLHALGRSASDWLPIMEAMQADWRCIAFDQRGHGESVRPGEYSFELLEQDFRDFVDALGLERFALVAHSMGGTVGWIFAEKSPERLKFLVVEDSLVPIDAHEYPEIPASPPEPVDYDWEVRRQLFRQLNSPDPSWWENVSKVTAPTLIIDGSGFAELQETVRVLPQAELVTIGVGHWIHESAPNDFVKTVRWFLHRSGSRRG